MTEQEKNANEQHWRLLVIMLAKIAEQKKITVSELATRAGLHQSHMSRFFAAKYAPTLRTFVQVARALDVNFFFEDKAGTTDLSVAFEKSMYQLGRRPQNMNKQ